MKKYEIYNNNNLITTRFLIHSHFSMAKKNHKTYFLKYVGKKAFTKHKYHHNVKRQIKVSIKVSKFPGATRVWGRLNVPSVEPHSQGSTVSITTWWPMQIKQGDFLMLMIVDLQLILSWLLFFLLRKKYLVLLHILLFLIKTHQIFCHFVTTRKGLVSAKFVHFKCFILFLGNSPCYNSLVRDF